MGLHVVCFGGCLETESVRNCSNHGSRTLRNYLAATQEHKEDAVALGEG